MIEHKCETAEKVLQKLEVLLNQGRAARQEFLVETYKNGRENGFAVINETSDSMLTVVFAESRGSDDIVVWAGFQRGDEEFDDDNVPLRPNMGRHFKPHSYQQAARFCKNWLMGGGER